MGKKSGEEWWFTKMIVFDQMNTQAQEKESKGSGRKKTKMNKKKKKKTKSEGHQQGLAQRAIVCPRSTINSAAYHFSLHLFASARLQLACAPSSTTPTTTGKMTCHHQSSPRPPTPPPPGP